MFILTQDSMAIFEITRFDYIAVTEEGRVVAGDAQINYFRISDSNVQPRLRLTLLGVLSYWSQILTDSLIDSLKVWELLI